jgi:hypothetical protein
VKQRARNSNIFPPLMARACSNEPTPKLRVGRMLYAHTGDPYWRAKAEHYALLVEPRVNDRATAGPDHHRALIIHDIIPLLHTGGRWRSDTGRASGEPCE